MFRIRFHGRGGHGMKTASRILGTAFFHAGYQVQDAPRYGAERRGAPIFAYVRADRAPIHERGVIACPDLVVVADDTLVPVSAAGVLAGVDAHTVLALASVTPARVWRDRLGLPGPLLVLPAVAAAGDALERRHGGAGCAGAAARLVGPLPREALERAVRDEIAPVAEEAVARNLDTALAAYDAMAGHEGCVTAGPEVAADDYAAPDWIDLPFDAARVSAPAVHATATSVRVRTGLWRTLRPVVDVERCRRCWWVCTSQCPDGAIVRGASGYPEIDYDHCKGCMICVAQCPPHAIEVVAEAAARAAEEAPS